MLPWSDLVHLKSKMSEARRSLRLQATDFSIARILAADDPSSSFSSSGSLGSPSRLEISESRVPRSPTIPSCSCCPFIILPAISNPERNTFLPIKEGRTSSADEGFENSKRIEKQLSETSEPCSESEKKISETTSDLNKPLRDNSEGNNDLPWLHCTRYRPPRLPKRSSAGKISKRKPGKHPRIPFTAFQLQILEDKYSKGAYLARRDVVQLSLILRLPQSRVKIWFQNRRARERRESVQLENETDKNILKVD